MNNIISYKYLEDSNLNEVKEVFGSIASDHTHISDGFSFGAFIDIIEVADSYRRKGVASGLILRAMDRVKELGLYQIEAWSSEDKIEAIHMWKKNGFGICFASIISGRTGNPVYGFKVAKSFLF